MLEHINELWNILLSVSPEWGSALSATTTTISSSFLPSIRVNGTLWASQQQCACTLYLASDSGAQGPYFLSPGEHR